MVRKVVGSVYGLINKNIDGKVTNTVGNGFTLLKFPCNTVVRNRCFTTQLCFGLFVDSTPPP
jgi:hypothetical protein